MRARSRSKKEPAPTFSLSALSSIIEQGSALICTVTAPDALCNRSDMTQMIQMHTTRARARCRRKNGGGLSLSRVYACARCRTKNDGERFVQRTARRSLFQGKFPNVWQSVTALNTTQFFRYRCVLFVSYLCSRQKCRKPLKIKGLRSLSKFRKQGTQKALDFCYTFVVLLFHFSSGFLPPKSAHFSGRSHKLGHVDIVSVLAPFWLGFGFSSFIPGVALWFAPAHVPRHNGRHREEGRFLSWF